VLFLHFFKCFYFLLFDFLDFTCGGCIVCKQQYRRPSNRPIPNRHVLTVLDGPCLANADKCPHFASPLHVHINVDDFTHSLIYSHSLAHILPHSLTHSLTHLHAQSLFFLPCLSTSACYARKILVWASTDCCRLQSEMSPLDLLSTST